MLYRTRLEHRRRNTAHRIMLSTKYDRTPWNLCVTRWDVLSCAKWDTMWCYSSNSIRDRNGALMNLLMDINHHSILLRRVCCRVEHACRYIWRMKCSGFFHSWLLSIRMMVVVFILAQRTISS